MEISKEQYHRLIRFLDADMTIEEMQAFDADMDANPELRAQMELEQKVRNAFEKNQDQIPETKILPLKTSNVKWWLAAATVLIVLAMVWLLIDRKDPDVPIAGQHQIPTKTSTPNYDSIYKEYYNKPDVPHPAPIILAEALDGYKQGRYGDLKNFNPNQMPEVRGGNDDTATIRMQAWFYKGIAALEEQDYANAIIQLQRAANSHTEKTWREKAVWYLSLAYIKNNESARAKKSLQQLTPSSIFEKQAKDILTQLAE